MRVFLQLNKVTNRLNCPGWNKCLDFCISAPHCTCYQPLSAPPAILILLTTDWRCLYAGIDILHSFCTILYCMLSMSDASGLLSVHRSKVNLALNLLPCMIYLRNTCLFRSLIAYAVGCLKEMQVSQNTRKVISLLFDLRWSLGF